LKKSIVVVHKRQKNESYQEAVQWALNKLDLNQIFNQNQKILVDLNLLFNESYLLGNITDPRTCEGVVDYLINKLKIVGKNIWVGDGGYSSETWAAIISIGLPQMAEKYGFNVIDLNKDFIVRDVSIPKPLSLKKVNISRTALEADAIISIPSLKTHSIAVTTLSIKNLMGAINPKGIMHSELHKRIADLFTLFYNKPKLAVIDGFIGSEGREDGGNPVEMDLVIAGTDFVAVDTVGSAIIGYSVNECKYLKYCSEKGLGNCNLDEIEIIGDSIQSVYRKFRR